MHDVEAPLRGPGRRRATDAPLPVSGAVPQAGRPGVSRPPASPGEVLHLQRTVGNRAVSGLVSRSAAPATRPPVPVTPRAAAPANALQRAVILLDVNPQDYALQKVLTGLDPANLRMVTDEGEAWGLDKAAGEVALIPYANLGDVEGVAPDIKQVDPQGLLLNNENVYIVGHGAVGGSVWTAPNHGGAINDFSSIVNAIKAMAGPGWTGAINVMTCNSEVRGDHNAASVTERITQEWGPNAPNVAGQGGFAYGMGTTLPGQMAVLDDDYDSLYKGDQYDDATAAHLLDRAENKPAALALINFTPDDDTLYPTLDDRKHGAWDAFVAEMTRIQNALNAIVLDPANANGVRGLDTLAKAQALQNHAAFQALITAQHTLFDEFELWA